MATKKRHGTHHKAIPDTQPYQSGGGRAHRATFSGFTLKSRRPPAGALGTGPPAAGLAAHLAAGLPGANDSSFGISRVKYNCPQTAKWKSLKTCRLSPRPPLIASQDPESDSEDTGGRHGAESAGNGKGRDALSDSGGSALICSTRGFSTEAPENMGQLHPHCVTHGQVFE